MIGADYADQDMKDPKIIKLHAIKAELSSADGGWSRMNAVRGVFDSKSERLVMQDQITVATSTGITGELKHASLMAKTQTLRSHRPVSFAMPNGTVSAGALTFRSFGQHADFPRQGAGSCCQEGGRPKVGWTAPQAAAPKEAATTEAEAPLAVPPLPPAIGTEDLGQSAGGLAMSTSRCFLISRVSRCLPGRR